MNLPVRMCSIPSVLCCFFPKIAALYEGVHSRPLPRADALVDPDFNT